MTRPSPLAAAIFAAAVGVALRPAPAAPGAYPPAPPLATFVVERFETGPVNPILQRFYGVGRGGATDVHRDDRVRLTFSGAIDLATVNPRTVQIVAEDGSPASPAENPRWDFHLEEEFRFDPITGGFELLRVYRRHLLVDPTAARSYGNHNPYGFAASTTYTVTLPGTDEGATETVRSRSGVPLGRTFRTNFHTGTAYNRFFLDTPEFTAGDPPSVESIEGSDAPGVPLDGRTDVDRRASVVVRYSGPILRSSFRPRRGRTRRYSGDTGDTFRFRARLSQDGTVCTFRPRRPLPAGAPLLFQLDPGYAGRSGRSVGWLGPVMFEAERRR